MTFKKVTWGKVTLEIGYAIIVYKKRVAGEFLVAVSGKVVSTHDERAVRE